MIVIFFFFSGPEGREKNIPQENGWSLNTVGSCELRWRLRPCEEGVLGQTEVSFVFKST